MLHASVPSVTSGFSLMVTIFLVLKPNVLIMAGNWQEYVATVMEFTAMIFKRKMAKMFHRLVDVGILTSVTVTRCLMM